MALGPQHEEGFSLSDLLVPLGLAIVLTTSVSIAKEHPIKSLALGESQTIQTQTTLKALKQTALVTPLTPNHFTQTK